MKSLLRLLPPVFLLALLCSACAILRPAGSGELDVDDFAFDGPIGSEGATVEKLATNHFRVKLGHAPTHTDWPNKLNFRILRDARGKQLRLEVVFEGGKAYPFNEYHQSFSYDGVNWTPIMWQKGMKDSPQADVLEFPVFEQDRVWVGTQVPLSYEQALEIIDGWKKHPDVRVHEIGRSTHGLPLLRVEITGAGSKVPRNRRWVHYLANQHPGEHNSQWRLVGMVNWILSGEGADFRNRSITHVVLMMSPDAPSRGWYRVSQEGVDMNRSYRTAGAAEAEQVHEAYLWQRDLESLMASEAPPTDVWAIHTWPGLVDTIMYPGPEVGRAVAEWTRMRDLLKQHDTQKLWKELRVSYEMSSYGPTTWSGGPKSQFGITSFLCEGGGDIYTKEQNMASGVVLARALADYYHGTRPAPDTLSFEKWGRESLDAIKRDLYIPDRHLYAETGIADSLKPTRPSYMWGAGVQLTALSAAAGYDKSYTTALREFADALESYWTEHNGIGGYDSSSRPRSADRYYDDNVWVVLGLAETFEVTNDRKYLDRAEASFQFVLSGEDEKLGGGIYWRENELTSKNTCSNAPSIAAALRLYQITKKPEYLATAKRLYDWTRRTLQDSDGLYLDNIRMDGSLDRRKYSYNTALMIRSNALFYAVTGEKSYLDEALREARAAEAHWVEPATGGIKDGGRFAHLLTDSFLDLYRVSNDRHWLDLVSRTLTYVHENLRDPNGRYPGRWDRPRSAPLRKFEMIDQASPARAYWSLALVLRD